MNDSANVKSTAAIQEVKASLAVFTEQAKESLTEVELEIRRVMEWVMTEQPQFWQRQIREWGERVSQAKVDLMRCRMFRVTDDHIPDCMEQKIALRKAEQRLAEAEEKLKRVRDWGRQLPQVIDEYLSQAQQLNGFLDGDLHKAAAMLDRVTESLEMYTSLAPPTTAPAASSGSMAREASSAPTSTIAPNTMLQKAEAIRKGGNQEEEVTTKHTKHTKDETDGL